MDERTECEEDHHPGVSLSHPHGWAPDEGDGVSPCEGPLGLIDSVYLGSAGTREGRTS
jgi:hypothetical protein